MGRRPGYIMVHDEEIVGYLYHEKADFGSVDVDLIRAYGVVEQFRERRLGSALLYTLFKALAKFRCIVADIDKEHPDALKCIERAAEVFGRKVVALGRIVMTRKGGVLEENRRPRYENGESMEYCAMLKGAPELTDRQEEKDWPALDVEDVPATKGGEGKQGGGKKKKKKTTSGKLGGRPRNSVQFVKKGRKEKEEEKKKGGMKKKEEKKSKSRESKNVKKGEGEGKKRKSKKKSKSGKKRKGGK